MNYENSLQNMISSCEQLSNSLDFAITLMVANGSQCHEHGHTMRDTSGAWHYAHV